MYTCIHINVLIQCHTAAVQHFFQCAHECAIILYLLFQPILRLDTS